MNGHYFVEKKFYCIGIYVYIFISLTCIVDFFTFFFFNFVMLLKC